MARVKAALPTDAVSCLRRVNYYDKPDEVGVSWAFVDRIGSSKDRAIYSDEEESRVMFSLTNALAEGNVEHRLVHESYQPDPSAPSVDFYDLDIGGIQDICRLWPHE